MHVLQLRGGFVETSHPVRAVAVRDGAVVWQGGEESWSPWRSACKPLQLHTSLSAIGQHFGGFTGEELAVGASSHSAQDFHLDLVRGLLQRFGLPPEALRCGAHPPVHTSSAEALACAGRPPEALHNNCSGKHTFMLGACVAQGWDLDYLPLEHPLQQRNLALVTDWAAQSPGVAVDGCGVPTFYLSIAGMARSWARLAGAMASPDRDPVAAAIGGAMARHPRLTSGDGRLDLALAGLAREPWVGKMGAQGIFCIALPERGLGIAIKVTSGDSDALAAAVPAVVDAVAPGALTEQWRTGAWPWATVLNVAGRSVGRRVVVGLPGA